MTTISAAHQIHPRVVEPGGMSLKDNSYKGDGSATLEPGNLIRITTSNQIKVAVEGATAAGDVHGICLSQGYHTTAATTSQFVVIMEFAADTRFHIQIYAASAGDAEPQDVAIGTGYRIVRTSSYDSISRSNLDIANADGSLIVDKLLADVYWFDFNDNYASGVDYGIVQCKVTQAQLEGKQS